MNKYELIKRLQDSGYSEFVESLNSPRDFGYHGDTPLFETWGYCMVLETRDSDILTLSNSAAIQKMIVEKGLQESFSIETFNHWACGHLQALLIRLYIPESDSLDITAMEFIKDIKSQLEDYPVLDDNDFSEREYEDFLETLENCYKWDLERDGFILPDNWVSILSSNLEYSDSESIRYEDLKEIAELEFQKEE